MEKSKILDSRHLKAGKSNYLVDLVKHSEAYSYVEIMQTVASKQIDGGAIRIHPDAIMGLIKTLQEFQIQIILDENKELIDIAKETKDRIQKSYFDMVEIKDIAMQLSLTEENVLSVLEERGIEIVSQKKPFKKFFKKRY